MFVLRVEGEEWVVGVGGGRRGDGEENDVATEGSGEKVVKGRGGSSRITITTDISTGVTYEVFCLTLLPLHSHCMLTST